MIYLDNAATTCVDPRVVESMLPFFAENYGNASSLHAAGVVAARALRQARDTLVHVLALPPGDVVFTSGGTEADALAVLGAARASRGRRVLVSAVEHAAVYDNAHALAAEGYEVVDIPVDRQGVVDVAALQAAADPNTALVSVMHANNEIGTVQPIAAIGSWLKAQLPECRFHVDAVQSLGRLPIDVRAAGIDLLSVSSHKIHGPKGAGALFVRKGVRLKPLIGGGRQESGLRPGTENVPAIVGFARAAALAAAEREATRALLVPLRARLVAGLRKAFPDVEVNGHPTDHVAGILSVNFPGAQSELLLHHLEELGIAVSSGAACHARERGPSRVLKAVGVSQDRGTVRLSLSRFTSEIEITEALGALAAAVPAVRALRRRR